MWQGCLPIFTAHQFRLCLSLLWSLAQHVGSFVSSVKVELSAYTKPCYGLALWPSVLIACGESPHPFCYRPAPACFLKSTGNPEARHSWGGISSVWPAPAPSRQTPQSHVPLCLALLERPRRGASEAAPTPLIIILSYLGAAWESRAITPPGSSRTVVYIPHLNSLVPQPLGHFRFTGEAEPPLYQGHRGEGEIPCLNALRILSSHLILSSNKAVSKIASRVCRLVPTPAFAVGAGCKFVKPGRMNT